MRTLAVPLLLVAALSLTGCVSAREVPQPMNDAELQQLLEDRLDAAWRNTGLDGTVERPESDPATLVERFRDSSFEGMLDCMSDQGIESWGSSEQDGGPILVGINDEVVEPWQQAVWFGCYAESPSSGFGGYMLSRAEHDYLYGYYREWLVPCLELKGYSVGEPPTLEQFAEQTFYVWVPYNAISPSVLQDPYGFGLSEAQLLELVDQCGDAFPGMDYGEGYGF